MEIGSSTPENRWRSVVKCRIGLHIHGDEAGSGLTSGRVDCDREGARLDWGEVRLVVKVVKPGTLDIGA